jgi:hypothetical protein
MMRTSPANALVDASRPAVKAASSVFVILILVPPLSRDYALSIETVATDFF